MIIPRRAVLALLAVFALDAGGCKGHRRTSAPVPPPTPAPAAAPAPAPAPAAAKPQPTPQAPVVYPPKPKPEPAQVPAPPPPAPPAFGQILTPLQQTEFHRSYQVSAQFSRQTLGQLSGRALSRGQAETANRIRSFLSQADEIQSKDPAVAAQLARRAELLARDLLHSFQ